MKLLVCLLFVAVASTTKRNRYGTRQQQWYTDFGPYLYNDNTPYQTEDRYSSQPSNAPSNSFNTNRGQADKSTNMQQHGTVVGNRNQNDDYNTENQYGSTPYPQVNNYTPQNQGIRVQSVKPIKTQQPQGYDSENNNQNNEYESGNQYSNNQYPQSSYTPQNQGTRRQPTKPANTQQSPNYGSGQSNQNENVYQGQQYGNTRYPQSAYQPQMSTSRPSLDGPLAFPASDNSNFYNPNIYGQTTARPIQPYAVESPPTISQFSSEANRFALDMLKLVQRRTSENIVLSPLSLSTLLALLQQGASGRSLQQLNKAVGQSSEESRRDYSNVMNTLKKSGAANTLKFANSIWVERNFPLKSSFKNTAVRNFNAEVKPIEFQQSGLAAQQINSWVSDNTKGIIKNLISPSQIDPSTSMILVNALYFKGLWKSPFDPERTARLSFSPTPSSAYPAQFMHQDGSFVGGEDKEIGARWLELPFEGDQYSMVFILPVEQHDLNQVVDRLNSSSLNKILNSGNKLDKVVMSIPKFDLGFESQLSYVLQQLGVQDIFTSNSGLTGISNGPPVYVSKVLQKAAITVDEFGSTGAVSTALAVNTLSLSGYWDEFRFYANQPFLSIIMDKRNQVPLFVSKITNPSSSNYRV